ncbi:hypothetical protein M3664_04900 [Paenibacillus lautus]|uniref:hypothetical protein n=1 Tax=Paenibacillus lautus TaxID=1401 RepID=UPI00203DBDB3|nr:hypothetical protein [Paenibacillus lautus]MCM3257121.1 hypothetical protein [Paenibacillus lautus]
MSEQNKITDSQRKQMEHALGLNKDPKQDRNYFYASSGNADWDDLVDKGYAVKRPGWDDESAYYHVTDEGKKLLGVQV